MNNEPQTVTISSQPSITDCVAERFRRNQEQLTPDLAGAKTELMYMTYKQNK